MAGRYLPVAFTEQGVSMLSAVLRSDTAVKVSIKIINAFVEMRRFIQNNVQVFARLDWVEQRQLVFESETEKILKRYFKQTIFRCLLYDLHKSHFKTTCI